MTKIYYCEGDPPCTCEESHRTDICEKEEPSGNTIQEEGLEYYLGHEECKTNCTCAGGKEYCTNERWVNEMIRCTNKGKFRKDCNGIFEHRRVLCDKHWKEEKEKNDRRCGMCGSPIRSCCC